MSLSAEKLPIEIYQLPDNAVLFNTLTEKDGLIYQNDKLFTGVAYLEYENKHLKQITTYHKGLPDGPQFEWYKDGKNLLSANYKKGRLNGQYLAWYNNGAVIYNLVFKNGKLNYDSQFEDDDSREASEAEEADIDGEGNNDVKEK
jgi:antitoxin component YwqK of YwqJK toxin-antitoxin module